ncbi:hypothetical protein [Enterovirga aerilata]|uniref:Uncharacterized protein n=1 Tax=Enterovirga aerilata TaxID=2730920 RepID=A0A849IDA5_9HYPH|nr:hypothetical protein [Enterovirga sp. DB1703]NNM75231.1 hypothetical protein [Enterovirga sp. DB1703]
MPYYSPAELREKVFEAPLRTVEIRVSAPIINRHIAALERGQPAPKIKVGGGTIIGGGLHWYVASYVLGRQPVIEKVDPPGPDIVRYSLRQVIFEGIDWENMTVRRG